MVYYTVTLSIDHKIVTCLQVLLGWLAEQNAEPKCVIESVTLYYHLILTLVVCNKLLLTSNWEFRHVTCLLCQ